MLPSNVYLGYPLCFAKHTAVRVDNYYSLSEHRFNGEYNNILIYTLGERVKLIALFPAGICCYFCIIAEAAIFSDKLN